MLLIEQLPKEDPIELLKIISSENLNFVRILNQTFISFQALISQ